MSENSFRFFEDEIVERKNTYCNQIGHNNLSSDVSI